MMMTVDDLNGDVDNVQVLDLCAGGSNGMISASIQGKVDITIIPTITTIKIINIIITIIITTITLITTIKIITITIAINVIKMN